MKKWSWVKEIGNRAYVIGRLVFVKKCMFSKCMFKVYENIEHGDVQIVAEVYCLNGTVFAFSHDLNPVRFYEVELSDNLWGNWYKLSLWRKRKLLKEVEKAFLKQYPDF